MAAAASSLNNQAQDLATPWRSSSWPQARSGGSHASSAHGLCARSRLGPIIAAPAAALGRSSAGSEGPIWALIWTTPFKRTPTGGPSCARPWLRKKLWMPTPYRVTIAASWASGCTARQLAVRRQTVVCAVAGVAPTVPPGGWQGGAPDQPGRLFWKPRSSWRTTPVSPMPRKNGCCCRDPAGQGAEGKNGRCHFQKGSSDACAASGLQCPAKSKAPAASDDGDWESF